MGQAEDSVLQVCQLTELKQTKARSRKGTQTDSGISVRHFCQKTWESTVENGQKGKTGSEIKLLIQENSKHKIS